MDPKDLAHRQYLRGLLNRRIAAHMQSLDDAFTAVAGRPGVLSLLCACGREDCDQPLLAVSPEDFDRARESPHRFIIAPGHTTDIDDVVYEADGFAIVEIKPQYREERPVTADADYPF